MEEVTVTSVWEVGERKDGVSVSQRVLSPPTPSVVVGKILSPTETTFWDRSRIYGFRCRPVRLGRKITTFKSLFRGVGKETPLNEKVLHPRCKGRVDQTVNHWGGHGCPETVLKVPHHLLSRTQSSGSLDIAFESEVFGH